MIPSRSTRILPAWSAGWRKPDRRPIPEWAREHIRLGENYAMPGPFNAEVSRYMLEPFAAIQNELVREVHICAAIQTGKTLIVEIAIPWIWVNDPGPMMWTLQSDEDADEQMETRTWDTWENCKLLAPLWPHNRHKKTKTECYFGSFFFIANGANPNSLQSKSIRWKFNSELWLPAWQDVYKQAVGRVSAFARAGRSKVVNDSQSGNVGDVMDKAWLTGHRARWSCACPACGMVIPLRCTQKSAAGVHFGLVWEDDAKRADGTYNVARVVETARWRCSCGHEMPDTAATRDYWNKHGVYLPERNDAPAEIRSYWWSSLPVMPMRDMAREKAEALNMAHMGDMADLKTYKQQRENEPWEEQHLTVTIAGGKSGYKVADYGTGQKWEGETRRSMMIDRQMGMAGDVPHRWVEIRAWQAGGASRQLYFGRINTKEGVRELQTAYAVADRCVWQDARYERHEVFKECAEYGWLAFMGSDQNSWGHYAKAGGAEPTKVTLPYSPIQTAQVPGSERVAHYLLFNEDYFADILANLIAGRGVPWDRPDDASEEYEQQIKAEHKVEKRPGVWKWEKLHSTKANHGWDTSKAHVCFACVMKILALPRAKAVAMAAMA